MSEVLYHGKKYYEADRRAQVALASAGIYSFRYYPKDRLVIMTDLTVENFGCEKYYDPVPGRIVEQLVVPEDRKLCEDLFDKIDQGEKRVSTTLRTRQDQSLLRLTVTITDWDEEGKPQSAIGIVENPDIETISAEMVRALSDDYHSIYYILKLFSYWLFK